METSMPMTGSTSNTNNNTNTNTNNNTNNNNNQNNNNNNNQNNNNDSNNGSNNDSGKTNPNGARMFPNFTQNTTQQNRFSFYTASETMTAPPDTPSSSTTANIAHASNTAKSISTNTATAMAMATATDDQDNNSTVAATTATTATNSNMPSSSSFNSNTSEAVEDILRNLKETESMVQSQKSSMEFENVKDLNESFEHAFNPFHEELEMENEGMDESVGTSAVAGAGAAHIFTDDDADAFPTTTTTTTETHYEMVVKEALDYIRFRSQNRAALFKASAVTSTHSALPVAVTPTINNLPSSSTTTAAAVSLSHVQQPILPPSSHIQKQPHQSQPQQSIMNQNSNNTGNTPELGSTSGSGSAAALSVQLHPSSSSSAIAVMDATTLESRLLSPPDDVRKAVQTSTDMFRLNHFPHEGENQSKGEENDTTTMIPATNIDEKQTISNDNTTAHFNVTSAMNGLILPANPIYSLASAATHGNESPMQHQQGVINMNNTSSYTTTSANTSTPSMSLPPFSVVPSSPAPGKLHLVNHHLSTSIMTTTTTTANTTRISTATNNNNNNNNMNSTMNSNFVEHNLTQQRFKELEMERRWRREEEVERGVEKVLMAIMQAAATTVAVDSKATAFATTAVGKYENVSAARQLIDNALVSISKENDSELFSSGLLKFRPTIQDENDNEEDKEDHTISTTAGSKSVVEELLAEVDDSDMPFELNDDTSLPLNVTEGAPTPQAPSESTSQVMEKIDELLHFQETTDEEQIALKKNNTSIRPYTVEADGTLEVEAVDKGSRPSSMTDDSDDSDDVEYSTDQVLGPLSNVSGGTTGVVLDDNDGHDDFPQQTMRNSIKNTAAKKSKSSLKIIESITAAVRNGPKAGDIMPKNIRNRIMGDEIALPRKASMSQIKELYAHMLPYHSNKNCHKSVGHSTWFTEKLSGTFNTSPTKHSWDDEDPDEPGYIVHPYSRLDLQSLEQDYEEVMETINKKYEIAVKKGQVKVPPKKKMIDANLTKNAKFPGKQQRRKNLNRSTSSGSSSKQIEDSRAGSSKLRLSNNQFASNPNFPNAKPAGSGEVGELEIYHLPIIYKAHQTGFEPTKDLVLQPDALFAGNYYVQGELGSAAFSTAYRCVDLNSGKKGEDGETYYDEVCLKVIKNTKDFFDQSLDEIKILELLRQTNQCHENNILEMKTFFYHKEHLIIVTELLRQNLFEFGKYISENAEPQYFTRDRLCYICRQCLVALSFVHKLGLVHSDIKPENILLASYSRARVKVIDFGSSCYLSDRQSSYIQSRSYRAPEVIFGLPYSGKIDIWSLGCVIAEMYTGQVTFQNDSVVTMLCRIEAICGAFPRHMIENGRQSGQFFTPTGLLYEKADDDDESESQLNSTPSAFDEDSDDGDSGLFNVFQPKITTMAERLGFDANLIEKKRTTWEEEEKALFVDFVTKLLIVDPDKRPTADEALEHPWILSGYNLSEEDLKYPPEE